MTKHAGRLERNRQSQKYATNHSEVWTEHEIVLLFEEWGVSPIEDIAAVLGRTIEACREKYHKTSREGLQLASTRDKTRPYRGWTEADGDGWD